MQALKEHFCAGEWRFKLMRNELDLVLLLLGYLTYCIRNVQLPLALYILLLNQLSDGAHSRVLAVMSGPLR